MLSVDNSLHATNILIREGVLRVENKISMVIKNQSFCICRFSHFLGLFCVLLGQSADRCPIFFLLVIETFGD